MSARTWCKAGVVGLVLGPLVVAFSPPVTAVGDGGHGFGRMGPAHARTVAVSPSAGPDFEMPFLCGTTWTGSSRSGHSPSYYTIDFNGPDDLGKPVLASAPGVVIKAQSLTTSYGRHVVIDHGNGYSTLYGHLNQIATSVGATVDQGDLIGYLGTSGNSTGPHLHFEERKDGAYFPPYFHRAAFQMGSTRASANCGDRPIAADWNGDGTSEPGIFRTTPSKGEWWLLKGNVSSVVQWGYPGDRPVAGSWAADRTAEVAVRRMLQPSFLLRWPSGQMVTLPNTGYVTDIPLAGDWDGNGVSDVGLFRPSTRTFWLRTPSGTWTSIASFAGVGETPVAGDWNGDGKTDVGTWKQATGVWRLRIPKGASYSTAGVRYGVLGDLPVTGDWNGDGITDVGTWRSSKATFWMRTPSGAAFVNKTRVYGNPR